MLSAEYNVYMDIQQALNLELYSRFDELGIEFAYPTRTLFMVADGSADAGGADGAAQVGAAPSPAAPA